MLLALVVALQAAITCAGGAQAAPGAGSGAVPLVPAAGQAAPQSLLDARPIPAVWAAAVAAHRGAPLPRKLSPASASQDPPFVYIPYRCVPRFGSGVAFDTCPLGDVRSRHVVALIGDSHAWMWIPGLSRVAQALHFRLVPVTKPGCLLSNLYVNHAGWPCLTWYQRALRVIARLHPSATIVSFMTSNLAAGQASWAAAQLQGVLRAVPRGVVIADPPNYNAFSNNMTPGECLRSARADQGTCARPESPDMRATLAAIQAMARGSSYPVVPTLQWFCAGDICPVVIDGTVTSEDGSHITSQYSKLLAPLIADALRPTLAKFWR